MTENFTQNHYQNVLKPSESTILNQELSKFKPWVFRPKKVIYSLDDLPPNKKEFSTSHWNDEQNNKYIDFLIKFRQVIEGEKKRRRKWHLNRIMSKFIGTRSHEQCRSHHQKMIKNYKNIEGIISHLQNSNPQRSNADSTSTSQPTNQQNFLNFIDSDKEANTKFFYNPFEYDESCMKLPIFFGEQSDSLF